MLAASHAWAALNYPAGLALDAQGNLYVANTYSDQVSVYNPSYVQLTAKTIFAGVYRPSGLAFDSKGNLYVSNSGTNTVTKYNPSHVWLATITTGIDHPDAVSVDSLDDLWVLNGSSHATFYSRFGVYLGSSTPGVTLLTIATSGSWYVLGTIHQLSQYPTAEVLTNRGIVGSATYNTDGNPVAMCADAKGNFYLAEDSLEIGYLNSETGVVTTLVPRGVLPDTPFGVAVDSVRGRLYVSFAGINQIQVYSISTGALLTTIR